MSEIAKLKAENEEYKLKEDNEGYIEKTKSFISENEKLT